MGTTVPFLVRVLPFSFVHTWVTAGNGPLHWTCARHQLRNWCALRLTPVPGPLFLHFGWGPNDMLPRRPQSDLRLPKPVRHIRN
jgi:hypothetical protein